MKKVVILSVLLAVATFGFAGVATADSFTGSGNIIWTFTNSGSDGSGGFLVTLQVDASNPTANAGTSTFDTLAVQFFAGSGYATGSTIRSTSSNTTGWTLVGLGNVNHCGTGNLPFNCATTPNGVTITGGVNSGVYTFLFDVTGLNAAPTIGDVQALQGSLSGSNGNYAISQSFGIGTPPTPVPEPASLILLGFGLLCVRFLRCKRS